MANPTPVAVHTAAADPTSAADPTPAVNPTPVANPTPGVRPAIIARSPVYPPPVCTVLVRPLPMADTLGRLIGGGPHSLDGHNPPANWQAQCWLIGQHPASSVTNCVRYCYDDENTIQIVDFRC